MSNELPIIKDDKPWYEDGVYFKCTGCGKCCTGAPGFVWLTKFDLAKLAEHFNISEKEFLKTYARKVDNKHSLKEDPENYDCIFLREGKYCSVYEARPEQCKTYPYWLENIKTKKDWDNEAKFCEGINHENATLVSKEDIEKQLLRYLETRAQFF